jgi:hypothetical protein
MKEERGVMTVEETKGRVSRIWQNETRSGKPYWVISIQSEAGPYVRYSVWDWRLLEGVDEGDIITYKFKQSGNYSNITEISRTEKIGVTTDEILEYQMAGRPEVARMSAIKSAARLLSVYDGDPQEKMLKTLEAAKEFERYIFGTRQATGEGDGGKQGVEGRRSRKRTKKGEPQNPSVSPVAASGQVSPIQSKPDKGLPF